MHSTYIRHTYYIYLLSTIIFHTVKKDILASISTWDLYLFQKFVVSYQRSIHTHTWCHSIAPSAIQRSFLFFLFLFNCGKFHFANSSSDDIELFHYRAHKVRHTRHPTVPTNDNQILRSWIMIFFTKKKKRRKVCSCCDRRKSMAQLFLSVRVVWLHYSSPGCWMLLSACDRRWYSYRPVYAYALLFRFSTDHVIRV